MIELPTVQCIVEAHFNTGGCYNCCSECNYNLHRCGGCGDDLVHDGTEYVGLAVDKLPQGYRCIVEGFASVSGPRLMHSVRRCYE